MPAAQPGFEMGARLLRFGAENRIAAADVRHHRMRAAALVLELDHVFFAWPAAIAIAGSGGKKAAEHAVLGVKDGQMLIGDRFEFVAPDQPGERGDLRGIQIVGRREAREAERKIRFGAQRIRGIETEIADQFGAAQRLDACRPIAPGWRNPDFFKKSTMRRSPGFSTRGLATRAAMPADFTRSMDGRRP